MLDQVALRKWLATRPGVIRKMAARNPPGSTVTIDGEVLFVVSYYENGGLGVSTTDPAVDYEGAIRTRLTVCAECLRKKCVHWEVDSDKR